MHINKSVRNYTQWHFSVQYKAATERKLANLKPVRRKKEHKNYMPL